MARLQGDLPDRTYRFALLTMALVDQLPQRTTGWELGRQVFRSGTGIGANIREADVAFTDREFAHICNVARREANETHYWLSLCRDHGMLHGAQVEGALVESKELTLVLSSVVQKTQQYLSQRT